jgi:hypothetical protein
LLAAATASAQSIPGAVLAKREPHHHLVYEDSAIRVLRVRVPGHDTTLLHEHDPDYFWIALGASTVVNAKLGSPDATITSPDLSIHYTLGHFAHVARNPGGTPFDNITVELLGPQMNVRNLCETALADKPLDCPAPSAALSPAVAEHAAFSTDRLRVSLLTIAPGGTVHSAPNGTRTWLIALDTADVGRGLVFEDGAKWIGGTSRRDRRWALDNKARVPLRVIAVVER